MPFVHQVTARLYDIDRAGVVFFATYYKFCHDTLEEMLAQLFAVPLEEAFAQGLWLCPVVHSEADYLHPIRLGQRCTVSLSLGKVSPRTIAYLYTISLADGTLCARLRLVTAFVDPTGKRAVAVPASFLAGLQRLGLLPDAALGQGA
jgi:YbgC/YbaW family acyl-CoA thioester hydrolase